MRLLTQSLSKNQKHKIYRNYFIIISKHPQLGYVGNSETELTNLNSNKLKIAFVCIMHAKCSVASDSFLKDKKKIEREREREYLTSLTFAKK